jgi:hypothetical protein
VAHRFEETFAINILMKKLAMTCLAAAAVLTISACAIFDDEDKPVTTTTTEETHSVHTAPASVGVTTQTQSVQSAY